MMSSCSQTKKDIPGLQNIYGFKDLTQICKDEFSDYLIQKAELIFIKNYFDEVLGNSRHFR